MPIIPMLGPVQGNLEAQAPSIGAAMATGKATAAFGGAVSDVGDDLGQYSAQLSRARDAGVKANASLAMTQAYAEHQEYRMQNPDESTWEADITSRVSKARESIMSEKMSPFMKAELDAQLQGWGAEKVSSVRLDGMQQTRQRSRQRITNAAEAYKLADDYESARKTIESGRGTAFLPEETDADLNRLNYEEQNFTKEKAFKADLAEIDQDPFTAREKYASPTPPEGTDPTEYHRKREYHRQRIAREQGSIIDAVRDGIASGKITRTDQLDEYQDELGAATISTLKSGMEKATDEGRKKLAAMPAYQARIIGSVSSAIDELDPNDIEARVKIEARLDDILPGPTKTQLSGELSRKLSGEPTQPGPMRRVRTMLNEATRRGYFGPVGSGPEQTVADLEGDGFLKDPANMKKLFSEEDAAAIADPKLKPAERLAKFRETWPRRNTKADNPEDYTLRAGEAIYQRAEKVPKTKTEKGAEFRDAWQALQRKGEIEQALIEWQQDHPEGDVEAELMRRMGDAESQAFLDSMDGGNWFGDEFMADPTGDPTEPDLPSTFGGSVDSLLPNK
jgi:hypothetical protein